MSAIRGVLIACALWGSTLCACIEVGVIGDTARSPSETGDGSADTPDAGPSPADGGCAEQPGCMACVSAATCSDAVPYCHDGHCVACLEDEDCATRHCEDGRCEVEDEDELETELDDDDSE